MGFVITEFSNVEAVLDSVKGGPRRLDEAAEPR